MDLLCLPGLLNGFESLYAFHLEDCFCMLKHWCWEGVGWHRKGGGVRYILSAQNWISIKPKFWCILASLSVCLCILDMTRRGVPLPCDMYDWAVLFCFLLNDALHPGLSGSVVLWFLFLWNVLSSSSSSSSPSTGCMNGISNRGLFFSFFFFFS